MELGWCNVCKTILDRNIETKINQECINNQTIVKDRNIHYMDNNRGSKVTTTGHTNSIKINISHNLGKRFSSISINTGKMHIKQTIIMVDHQYLIDFSSIGNNNYFRIAI